MIAIIDYGMSNLRSVRHALEYLGAEPRIVQSPEELEDARGIVLPGDGAFGQTMKNLQAGGWIEPLIAAIDGGMPFLGICLGMQLLFETSEELGEHRGLGVLPGRVVKFPTGKIPQVGWNQLQVQPNSQFLEGVSENAYAYFVHSYYCEPQDGGIVSARTEYGINYASVVERGNVWGAQFHPEKSGEDGLQMLANFITYTKSVIADDLQFHCLSRD